MGINNRVFELLMAYGRGSGENVALVAGYPDFLVYPDVLTRLLGRSDFPTDPASDAIKEMHCENDLDYARDPIAIFKELGYIHTDIIDIYQERGCELVVDLNYPSILGSYDLVLDHGTIEHCFNIAQAAINLANAVKQNGIILQHLPMNMVNHGFYNISPTWFYDFYETNGFEIKHLEGWCWANKQSFEVPRAESFTGLPEHCLLTMIAQRTVTQEVKYPIQCRYRK